jgi:uncharacterized membrane protein
VTDEIPTEIANDAEPRSGWSEVEPWETLPSEPQTPKTDIVGSGPEVSSALSLSGLNGERLNGERLNGERLNGERLNGESTDPIEPERTSLFRVVPRCIVAFGVLLFVGVFASLHLRNHRAFGSLAYDTAIYDQAIYLMGRTANPFMTVRGLYVHGHHVNPFLFVLVPISWLGGGAESFLIAQTISFACGAIPVFGLTRYLIAGSPINATETSANSGWRRAVRWLQPKSNVGTEWIAAGVAVAYLGSPVIQWINWAHVHPESFSTLPFLCAWWAMLRRRWGWFGLCVVILISTREETALAVTMMGLVMVWRTLMLHRGARRMAGASNKELSQPNGFFKLVGRWFAAPAHVVLRDVSSAVISSDQAVQAITESLSATSCSRKNYLPGLITSFIGGGWYLLCARFILPRYNNGRPPYYLKSFFGSLGGSVGGIIKTFFTDPSKIINLATKQDRLDYYWALGRPVGFVFLLSPAHLLMVVPSMLSNVLTDSQYPRQIEYQYAAVLVGPLWIATIYALARFRKRLPLMGVAVLAVIGLTYYAAQDFSPAPMSKRGEIYWAKPDARSAALTEAVGMIPANAGVAASDFVLPHLDRRRHAYLWPNPFEERYWGNYDPVTPTPLPDPNTVDWFVIDDRLLQPSDGALALKLTEPDGPFTIVYKNNGVLVGKRKPGRISPPPRR